MLVHCFFAHRGATSEALTGWLAALPLLLSFSGCIPSTRPAARELTPPRVVHKSKPAQAPAKNIAPEPTFSEPRRAEKPSNGETRTKPAGERKIALTLDLGPWADAKIASGILDILEERGVHATLFFSGKCVEKYPGLVARAVADGHQLGNHTYSHPDLTKLSREAIIQEVEKTQSLLENAAGHEITPFYFRPPYGATNKKVEEILESLGFRSVMWTIEALDWQEGATVEKVVDRVLKKAKVDAIILMHITEITQEALPLILEKLRAQAYEFAGLETVLPKPQKK